MQMPPVYFFCRIYIEANIAIISIVKGGANEVDGLSEAKGGTVGAPTPYTTFEKMIFFQKKVYNGRFCNFEFIRI
jgi:hypothetical protein